MNFKLFLRDNKEAVDINISMPTNANALAEFVEKNNIGTIVISAELGFKEVGNIDFLANIINKQNILEVHIMSDVEDYSSLYKFKNLRKITLCYHKKIATSFDILVLPTLEYLSLNGNVIINGLESSKLRFLMINDSETFKITSKCESIEKLEVVKSKLFDLNQVKYLPNLKNLSLTQLKIVNLKGLEFLDKIEELEINYCNKLVDISSLSLCKNIRKLEFDSNKNIENFENLSSLHNLVGLVITNCGDIQSLKFIKEMKELKFLSFVNTNIVDGDLRECLNLENVKSNDKKHYNVLSKNLPNNKEYSFWKL